MGETWQGHSHQSKTFIGIQYHVMGWTAVTDRESMANQQRVTSTSGNASVHCYYNEGKRYFLMFWMFYDKKLPSMKCAILSPYKTLILTTHTFTIVHPHTYHRLPTHLSSTTHTPTIDAMQSFNLWNFELPGPASSVNSIRRSGSRYLDTINIMSDQRADDTRSTIV